MLATIQSKLLALSTALVSIPGLSVGHYFNYMKEGDYCVWAEDTEAESVHGDNIKQKQTLQGTVDFFTKTEFNPKVDSIQNAMNTAEISWRLSSVQYEDETGYIHYEWVFEV